MAQVASVRELVERQVAPAARALAEVVRADTPRISASAVGALWEEAYEFVCDFLIDEYSYDLLDYVSARDIALMAVALYLDRLDRDEQGEWFDAALTCLHSRFDRLLARLCD